MNLKNGILAFGCSFTWGEGLYYYSDLPNLPFSEYHEYNESDMTEEMISFKNKHRYLNLISTDLNIPYEYAFDAANGGSTIGSFLSYNNSIFDKDYSKIKYIIWQTSAPEREWSTFPLLKSGINDTFYFMTDEDHMEYFNMEIKRQLMFMHKRILEFESMGCDVIIFNWCKDYPDHPYYNKHFKKYHLPLIVEGNSYSSFDTIHDNEYLNEKYTISGDFLDRGLQKNDTHFNLKGQRMIADNIINRIKQLSIKK